MRWFTDHTRHANNAHIAVMWKAGDTVDEIVLSYPHLEPAWVHDAISYYLDHREEIEREIEANKIENVLAKLGGVMDENGGRSFRRGKGRV